MGKDKNLITAAHKKLINKMIKYLNVFLFKMAKIPSKETEYITSFIESR